jgi:hypothetical protein
MIRTLLFSLPVLIGCNGNNDETDTDLAAICGDIDGTGTDTGDIPNVLGYWSSNFGQTIFDENCNGFEKSDVSFLTGPIEINGYVPDGLRLDFDSDKDRRLRGIASSTGGMVFAGQLEQAQGMVHISIGGLVYEDSNMGGRDVWAGGVFVGLDADQDGQIDCDMRGDWTAFKSGS